MIGKKRDLPLWQIVTRTTSDREPKFEPFERLRHRVFSNINLLEPKTYKDIQALIDSYIPKQVTELESGQKDIALGSGLIREIKATHDEPAGLLTYEHLFVDRLAAPTYNILLVGDTGSGKSHKLEYVWHKYVKPYKHCPVPPVDCIKERMRIKIDVDNCDSSTAAEFYREVFVRVLDQVTSMLGDTLGPKYGKFVGWLFDGPDGNAHTTYFPHLRGIGLTSTKQMSLVEIGNLCQGESQRYAVLFALHFCGWLRKEYSRGRSMCVHVVFDNVDVSPRPVQDAVVRLLQSMSPDDGVLMICACRPETLVNWDHGATILDVISHVGPNAHEVVVNRLSAFLKSPPDGAELTDLLQASREPKDFLQNLEFITKRIEDGHFARFFNDYFGSRIRNALVFAMRSVDLAASRHFAAPTNPSQEITDHDLERRLYRPWGLSTPVRGISNIFGCSPNRERRLAGVRILVFLYPYAAYAKTVEQICQHMGIFGYSHEETIISLNSMLHARLVIARTKERYRLGTYDSCREEPVKITDMGEGIYRRFTEYSYVTGIMYDTICSERLYGSIRSDEQDLLSVLYTLRIFLIETVSIELSELRSVADKHGMDDYNAAYEGAAISPALYHSIIPTVTRIGLAQKKDGVASYTSVLETGFRMLEEDYNAGLADKLVKDFEISVHPDEDVMSMFDRLRDEYLGFASAR